MGERVEASALVVGRDHEVQRRLGRSVAALRRMVDGDWFVGHEDTVGMEVEFDLVDPLGRPRLINDAVLARLGRADMQHELGKFNVELNVAARRLSVPMAISRAPSPAMRPRQASSTSVRSRALSSSTRPCAAHTQRRSAHRRADLGQPAIRVAVPAHARRAAPAIFGAH